MHRRYALIYRTARRISIAVFRASLTVDGQTPAANASTTTKNILNEFRLLPQPRNSAPWALDGHPPGTAVRPCPLLAPVRSAKRTAIYSFMHESSATDAHDLI